MKRTILLLAAFALLLSCGTGQTNLPNEGDNAEDSPRVEDPEKFSSFEKVPLKSSVTKVQPMTGIVLWMDNSNVNTDDIQLEYSYMRYNEVCKGKNKYDWSALENKLNAVASRGHQAVVRFYYTYVGQKCTVPDYIKAWPGYEETSGKSEGRTTYFPDWRCEELQRFHMEFHKEMANRYDKDPRLAFLETGFGLWAEYHIYDGPYVPGKTFPSKEFQATFMRGMAEWFKETTWSISIDAAGHSGDDEPTYGPFEDQPDLLKLRFGNFDDSFMCEDHDDYNYKSWKFFGTDRYKTAPLGGEFSYYTDSDQKHCLDKGGMHGRKFEDEAAKFHMTFIIGDGQPRYQSWSRIREASLSMGYRFCVKDFRISGEKAALLVTNTGVAPIYRDAWFAVDGVRSDWSLQQLMPGDEKWIEITVPGLSTGSVVSIECDHLVSGQRIGYDADIAG